MAQSTESVTAGPPEIHKRIVKGDYGALEQLAEELLLPLRRRLRRSFPRAAIDNVTDASNDAILTYVARPDAFDANRCVPLDRYLYGVAARILRDRLRSDKRRVAREGNYAEHILRVYGHRNHDRDTLRIAAQEVRRALRLVCDSAELAGAEAWLNEDDPSVVVIRLGLSGLLPAEQRREVRRFTARITNRLRRYFRNARVPAKMTADQKKTNG